MGGGQTECFSKKSFFWGGGGISCHFFHFRSISSPNPRQTYISYIFFDTISFIFVKTIPTSNPKGGAHFTSIFIFLLGHAHIWPKRGGGGMCLKCPLPPRSTYGHQSPGTVVTRHCSHQSPGTVVTSHQALQSPVTRHCSHQSL